MPRLILTLGILVGALSAALFVSACGGDDGGQFANEPTGDFPVEIIDAGLKPLQTVAETYDLTIAVRNSGEETIPAINTVIDLPGLDSNLPFAYADRQEGLAMNQRPVWVLEEGWPKLADTTGRGGTTVASRMTFEFGALEPGGTANMVWRLVAVRPGNYRLRYEIGAGLGTDTRAVDENGNQPVGELPVRISGVARLTEINEKGQIVPVSPAEQARVESQLESVDSEYLP
ncbi:MAG: hypothetical protein QG596_699 [Actinomycetota bacterium]|nr:hypothetical protein [Actinomycetota bacterium]